MQQYFLTPVKHVFPIIIQFTGFVVVHTDFNCTVIPSPNLLVDATNSPVLQDPSQAGAVPDQ